MGDELEWTEGGIRALKPSGSRHEYRDPDTGMVLLMTPAGVKTFYLVYRAGGGRTGPRRWFKLGVFGRGIGLERARKEYRVKVGEVAAGRDPQAERKAGRVAKPKQATVSDLCDRFLKTYVDGGQVSVATGKTYRLNIESNIRPVIGSRLVSEVRPMHITELLDALTPGQASHVRSTLNRLFTRAVLWELRDTNPVKGQDKPSNPDKRSGHRLTAAEFRKLGKALKGCDSWQLRGLVSVLALTGMRVGELAGSTWGGKAQRPWSDIDLKRGAIRLPAKSHKTGRKAGDRTVYLCPEAVVVLKALPRDGDLVLGGWKNAQHAWAEFRDTCGLGHINLHDFRHTYISTADELVTASTRAALVGHSSKSMSDHYTHKLDPELVAGSQKVGSAIGKMLGL